MNSCIRGYMNKKMIICKFKFKKLILIASLVTATPAARSQDLTNIKNAKPVTVSSSISANQVVYGATDMDKSRDPYSYVLSGNMNINLYGIFNVPLNFVYSSQQLNYSKPFSFNQFGISPSYKWIKVYAGYSNMSFSSFTLSGHQFLGGGIELTPPGHFKFSAMYGRLQQAVKLDTLHPETAPSYKRIGYGCKMGYNKSGSNIDLIVFKAKDDTSSLGAIPANFSSKPMENLVVSLNTSLQLLKKLRFTAEIANSTLTRDMRASAMQGNSSLYSRIINFWQPQLTTTSNYKALKSNVNYGGKGYSVGFGYERIDPDYQTLGAYYFTNDLENITINASKSLMKGKLNIFVNFGKQRNNLNNTKLSEMNQYVSNISINVVPSRRFSVSGNYSNFSSYTYIRSNFDQINQTSPYANIDTLNYSQLTNSASLNGMCQIGKLDSKVKRQTLMMNVSYQVASDYQNNKLTNGTSSFINSNMTYSFVYIPIALTISSSLNSSISDAMDKKTLTTGPGLTISKGLLKKKLVLSMVSSYNNSYLNNKLYSTIFTSRIGTNYSIFKRQVLSVSLAFLHRIAKDSSVKSYSEFTGMMGYSFSF